MASSPDQQTQQPQIFKMDRDLGNPLFKVPIKFWPRGSRVAIQKNIPITPFLISNAHYRR